MEATKVTPMMRQYLRIKGRYQDAILFFRLGDFYEMFFEDAQTASRILDITLTSRNRSDEGAVPLCGVPYHSADPYIRKLLEHGYKVAVCEQVEDPRTARGVVERDVVRVITPGTVTATEALEVRENNFLAAAFKGPERFGLAVTDITTGDFRCTQMADLETLFDEIARIGPSEILLAEGDGRLQERLRREFPWLHCTRVAKSTFEHGGEAWIPPPASRETARDEEWREGISAASALRSYLEANASENLKILRTLERYSASKFMILDDTTRRNLELVGDFRGDQRGSLLAVLDRTATAMGARRLRQWVLYPLLDPDAIRLRQDGVGELIETYQMRQDVKARLKEIQDLERLAGKILTGGAGPKDLVAVKETLGAVKALKAAIRDCRSEYLRSLLEKLKEAPEAAALIERSIVDEPPLSVKDGGFIREGFDAELDELRGMRSHAKEWIAKFETAERRRSGIQSLKVRYNRVFGYYIEVTKANLKSVPADYIRKQTLVNGERYITPELKEYETKVLNAAEAIEKSELALLSRVRQQVASFYADLKESSEALGALDVLLSLAEVAESCHFARPRVDGRATVSIREGRHPVVEAALGRGAFVPNDCFLDPDSSQIVMLTGPNMAGKSTYMRQVALIVILAQMGSFVPAAEAHVGVVDRIFTRIGATDALARGESTFMVEMKETAHILRHATGRSLILLDEVGRGTSTFDGISIAWAVAESLHDHAEKPRTLFATHYHELTDLALSKERVKNFNFTVKEWNGEILFLRNLVAGAASHSYGIHVGRLAGLPASVIDRAKEILKKLEGQEMAREGAGGAVADERRQPVQMALFASVERKIREELRGLDVSRLTPVDALNVLHRLSEEAKK